MGKEKVALKISNIGHSITHKNSYTVILSEIGGNRFIPLVVGAFEAQAIAVALENMKPSRPLTHDLLKNAFDACEITLQQVLISSQSEGVFYSSLICKNKTANITLDSRTSDALALALRFGCPIFTYEDLLQEVGLKSETEIDTKVEQKEEKPRKLAAEKKGASKAELEQKLNKALEDEDYELAARLRDELNKLS